MTDDAATDDATDDTTPDRPVADDAELQRLRRALRKHEHALRDRETRLRETEARLAALESSTALRVGQRLAAAARKPRRNLIKLPGELYRLAKGRAPAAAAPAVSSAARAGWPVLRTDVGQDERLLFGASVRPGDRLVIAGALTAETRRAFGAIAQVVPLSPHDAGVVVDQVDPDLVIFEAAACAAGHPWAFLGDPAATDKERCLAAVVEAARTRGRPVVLWRNSHCAPGLEAYGWDAIEDGDTGVPLDRFNPLTGPAGPARPDDLDDLDAPVYLGPLDPRLPLARRRLRDEIIAAVGARVVEAPDGPCGHSLVLADAPGPVLAALACGARVVSPHDDRLAELGVGDHVRFVADAPDAVTAVAAAREAGPPPPDAVRGTLRTLFTEHATAVRLAALTRRLGLEIDPLRHRRVSVLIAPRDAAHAATLVERILAQTHRPAELLLTSSASSASVSSAGHAAFAAAAEHGISVREGRPGSPWAARWPDDPVPDTYLADLLCAAECTGADAVGPGPGPDYSFVPTVEPALARAGLVDLLVGDSAPADRSARGARLLALTP